MMVDAIRGCVPAVVWVKMLQATITAYATAEYCMIFCSALCLLRVAQSSHFTALYSRESQAYSQGWKWICYGCKAVALPIFDSDKSC